MCARGIARRLSEPDVTELVIRYRKGATVSDLAKRFSIHRITVSGHLHRRCGGMAGCWAACRLGLEARQRLLGRTEDGDQRE